MFLQKKASGHPTPAKPLNISETQKKSVGIQTNVFPLGPSRPALLKGIGLTRQR